MYHEVIAPAVKNVWPFKVEHPLDRFTYNSAIKSWILKFRVGPIIVVNTAGTKIPKNWACRYALNDAGEEDIVANQFEAQMQWRCF